MLWDFACVLTYHICTCVRPYDTDVVLTIDIIYLRYTALLLQTRRTVVYHLGRLRQSSRGNNYVDSSARYGFWAGILLQLEVHRK